MRVYARKARLVLSSTFVEFMFFFLSLCYWVSLCFYYQLKSLSPNSPNFSSNFSFKKISVQENQRLKKFSDSRIHSFNPLIFGLLFWLLFCQQLKLTFLVIFRYLGYSGLSHSLISFSHDFRYYNFPCSDYSDYSD